jgi:general secretion pathway protein A
MYNKYFGFKEKPFKLVPNPEYLFLSKSHEEALAHLSFAIYHGDGFVEIIGEVGTGKTTLCRVFLENLDKSIEAAYIFNPKLDALQLLKAINDEFGIDSAPDNTKDLIDRLNSFLINKKSAGQKVLVLIDEAQNLSLEVLEQLRLLSNLETTQEKLLQIILVGQPELGEMLSSHQLRQLGQRITINCQLTPLTFSETKDYIKHRIALASHRAGPPFDNISLRAIYEYSRGVPRLINIACDRALLNAFSRNSFKITGAITKEAIRELNQVKKSISPRSRQVPSYIAFASVTIFALICTLLYLNASDNSIHSATSKTYFLPDVSRINMNIRPDASDAELQEEFRNQKQGLNSATNSQDATDKPQDINSKPGGSNAAAALSGSIPTEVESREPGLAFESAERSYPHSYTGDNETELNIAAEQFLYFLKSLNSRHSRLTGILQAVKLWNPSAGISSQTQSIENAQVFFKEAAEENELLAQPIATDTDLNRIQILNLPAVLTFYLPNHAWPKYLTIAGLDAANAYFDAGDQGNIITVDRRILLRLWSGEAYIVWKNFTGLEGVIGENSWSETVKSLKMLLRDLNYTGDFSSGSYDADIRGFIEDIQHKKGLEVDGVVGPFTKIILFNEKSDFIKPSLADFKAARTENGS